VCKKYRKHKIPTEALKVTDGLVYCNHRSLTMPLKWLSQKELTLIGMLWSDHAIFKKEITTRKPVM
jgi:hypothetical protein